MQIKVADCSRVHSDCIPLAFLRRQGKSTCTNRATRMPAMLITQTTTSEIILDSFLLSHLCLMWWKVWSSRVPPPLSLFNLRFNQAGWPLQRFGVGGMLFKIWLELLVGRVAGSWVAFLHKRKTFFIQMNRKSKNTSKFFVFALPVSFSYALS